MKPINVVDLFAGPGGLGEGFSSVRDSLGNFKFKLVASVEKDKAAHSTLTLRSFIREFEDRSPPDKYYSVLRGDISLEELFQAYPNEYERALNETLLKPRELGKKNDDTYIYQTIDSRISNKNHWVLIGGPPCQAYSLAGRARNLGTEGYEAEKDHRHFLYREYLQILSTFQPSVFVMENVKGILSSKIRGESIFDQILYDLESAGYNIYSLSNLPKSIGLFDELLYDHSDFVVKSEDYGIPQKRHRVILLGVRQDLSIKNSDAVLRKRPEVSVGQMIGDLPKLRSGLSKQEDSITSWKEAVRDTHNRFFDNYKHIGWPHVSKHGRGNKFLIDPNNKKRSNNELGRFISDKKIGGFANHETRSHMKEDLARYYFSANYARKHGKSPRLSEFPEILLPNHANKHSGKFIDRFKVQVYNDPSSTITSHIAKDGHYFIHYDPLQCRSLTVREAARLQTFPDNYYFCGTRTEQYAQVGNAVPPFLARLIAKNISKLLINIS